MAVNATGTPTSPDSIARIAPTDNPSAASLTTGINAIPSTIQTALGSFTYTNAGQSSILVYGASASVPGSADMVIFLNGEYGFSNGGYSFSNNRVTITQNGYYQIQAGGIDFTGSFAGAYSLYIRKNGATVLLTSFGQVNPTKTFGSLSGIGRSMGVFNLTVNDYLEMFWSHGTSTTVVATSGSSATGEIPGTSVYGFMKLLLLGT